MGIKEEFKQLQRNLAEIDLLTERRCRSSSSLIELLLLKLQEIKIKMYQERGHSMPHIHIDYGKQHHIASYSIDPASKICGSLSKRHDNTITIWISNNRDNLLKIWDIMQSGDNPENFVIALKDDE